jgi:hypothetical protein
MELHHATTKMTTLHVNNRMANNRKHSTVGICNGSKEEKIYIKCLVVHLGLNLMCSGCVVVVFVFGVVEEGARGTSGRIHVE